MKVVVSWSGGKDSCLACYKTLAKGFDVKCLLTMMNYEGSSSFHLIPADLLEAQAEAIGIPIVKRFTTPETYEEDFKYSLKQLRFAGLSGLVTGDIFNTPQHEAGWLNRICQETGMKPIKPLWNCESEQILREFIDLGFKATIVRTRLDLLGEEFLGTHLDYEFSSKLAKLEKADPCGERGEYHTLVTDGPLFKKRIKLLETRKSTKDHWGRLEIMRFELEPKGQ